ncbi:MAG TPA: hypothetical protein PLE92_02105 [Lentisphaeria bacterium]|nr:hypothetical protein [Lentisphaerota bacterium]HQC51898.1 hypothetical protein [Lentisphaeria bacterium]HQL87450.1 hypothetical protein [Lentisphaeria bacterium]
MATRSTFPASVFATAEKTGSAENPRIRRRLPEKRRFRRDGNELRKIAGYDFLADSNRLKVSQMGFFLQKMRFFSKKGKKTS